MSDTPDVSSVSVREDAVAESPQEVAPLDVELVQASQPYIGEWNQLVSTTNWEKGRIICAWRAQLIDSGAEASEYADEAWARLVGGVTGQHVGRLRRVSQRFGRVFGEYRGLYWSHFQAAIDWEDAEMWLEGAVQSGWSVSKMRMQRWETLGSVAGDEPQSQDEVAGELDEDFEPAQKQDPISSAIAAEFGEIASGPRHEGPDFGDEDSVAGASANGHAMSDDEEGESPLDMSPPLERVRPFESLVDLPDDVADAVERFKLLILRHRSQGWTEMRCEDMVAALDALRQFALAPPDDQTAPF
jgi:hypothetical protein